ncbi:uncharacterized protein LOC126901109 [Daktulosphaira vitifoliae]|uniref:uncharacterized protein LOC126901109 n=1 Tax=Daktulosphaira vitifoliae TaxID=58002 RepID=UPI0021A9C380|nr:uncharacterized protein LOC126901109 [Daktulosphaira vitifoliae]
MFQWPWLMICVALISTVQWQALLTESINGYYWNWREYSTISREFYSRPKRGDSNPENTTPITIDSNTKFSPRAIITTSNSRVPQLLNSTKEQSTSYKNNTIQSSNGLRSSQSKSPSVVIFPSSVKETTPISINKFIPDLRFVEKCSKNNSYCDKIDNYPKQDLQQIFRTSKLMSSGLFGVDAINDLETRFSMNVGNEPQPICGSLEQIVFPEAGLTKNDEWRFIVQGPNNDNNNFRQGIRVEKCINPGESCKFSENLPNGYTTTCVQKYIYRKLVAIKDTKEIYYESFRLPSCCACMYTAKAGIEDRSLSLRFDSNNKSEQLSIDSRKIKNI